MIDPDNITAFDVETKGTGLTYGLQPFRLPQGHAWLTTCAVAYRGEPDDELGIATEALIRPTPEQLSAWLDSILAAGHYVVCWNAPFDVAWLLAMDKIAPHLGIRAKVMKIKWLDGLLLYRHKHNWPGYRPEGRISMGLKPAVRVYLPEYGDYADDIDFNDESPENIAKLLVYNQRDARFTLHITRQLLTELPPGVIRSALIEAHAIALVAEANLEGLDINEAKAKELGVRLEEQRALAFVKLKMNNGADISEEVLASPKQLRELLFKKWGLPVINWTPGEDPSTDKEALTTLALSDPRAKLIHEYREAAYLKAKFSTALVGEVNAEGQQIAMGSCEYNGDGRSRPTARIFGAYTGRLTYASKTGKEEMPTGCAIHQWKRDPEFRDLIEAPEGCDIIEADFAGQEFRWMAVESGDPVMIGLCMPGEDAHAYMAARNVPGWQYERLRDMAAAGDKDAKGARQFGKFANLSLQYRTYPKTMVKIAATQHGLKITFEEAKAMRANYLTTYRAVKKYWERQIAFARNHHYVETLAGRRVYLGSPDTWARVPQKDGTTADWTWGHESTAINFPIQGVGADQKYLALLILKSYLPTVNARFMMELHDGLFVACPKDRSEKVARELKQLLSNLPYKRAWGVDLPIQFPVDVKVGPSWGRLKELKD